MPVSPVFGANRLKLATFGTNLSSGNAITTVPERLRLDWPTTLQVAIEADRAGFEAIIPVARWIGFGGEANFQGASFEAYTWAAGLAAATERAAVFATSHVMLNHPVMAAKQCVTVDHISDGRFGLNIVCGWFEAEGEMFGAEALEHDDRYAYATEWLEIVEGLWSGKGPCDFDGRHFHLPRLVSDPLPLQQPRPPIMNAGFSAVGRRWAAQHADIAFALSRERTAESVREAVGDLKRLAQEEFGRDIQVWMPCYVVCRPTEREAQEYLHHYAVEHRDEGALANALAILNPAIEHAAPHVRDEMVLHMAAGFSGYPLVGTPERIAETLEELADAGLDGCALSWVDFPTELRTWIDDVLPLLERAGLRAPAAALAP